MKVFVFDLLAYGEHLDHLKVGNELPYPLSRGISSPTSRCAPTPSTSTPGRRSTGWAMTASASTSTTARPTA